MFVLSSGCVLTEFNLYFDQHCILSYYYCILFSLSLFFSISPHSIEEVWSPQIEKFYHILYYHILHNHISYIFLFYISSYFILSYFISAYFVLSYIMLYFMFFIYIIWWYFLLSCQSFEADSLSSFLLFFFSVISTSYNQSSCFVIRRISVYGTEAHTLRV